MRQLNTTLRLYGLHLLLFVVCFIAYVSNRDFLAGSDQQGNMLLSLNLLKRQSFSFEPRDTPEHFVWRVERPTGQTGTVQLREWNQEINDLYEQGQLLHRKKYLLAETVWPDTYVNTFGMGTAITVLPLYVIVDVFVDVITDRFWLWHSGALMAAFLSALSVVLVLATARRFTTPRSAFLVAIAFGLGTCVWPTSSQALFQHSASILYLCLAAYLLVGIPQRPALAVWCGATLGMAVLCRPQNAVVVICVGIYLLYTNRRWAYYYMLGGLPFAVALGAYNAYYFGDVFTFGQTASGRQVAEFKTGSPSIWQGRLWESLPGLLFSPQRGIIWYSPVLLFGFYGAVLAWKNPTFRFLIPLQAAALLLILVAASWFDWWGGLTWGYRSILDATPYIILCMIPVIDHVMSNRKLKSLFVALLAWSVVVQFVGAYTFDGYNEMQRQRKEGIPEQDDLWRWDRAQIVEHLVNFRSERETKQFVMDAYAEERPMPLLYVDGWESDSP